MTNKKRKPVSQAPRSAAGQTAGTATKPPTRPVANQTAAQKRLAAQRAMAAASGAASARRKRQIYRVWAPILVVVVIVAVLGIVKLTSSTKGHATTAADSSVATAVTTVPASVLDTVGVGTASTAPTALNGAALTANGLPQVLYVGAEWCPYCAAERWPLAVALSRFGTLTGLGQTSSSPTDTDPNTPTLSFHGATYTSTSISFSGNEIEDGNHNALDKLSAADNTLFTTIGKSSFPFIDIGGKWQIPVQYDPGTLDGKSHAEIANALKDPSSSIAKNIDGSANVITAAICNVTGAKPAAVCSSSAVTAAAKKLT